MVVDDERMIRASIVRTLADAGLEIVGEAVNGEDAIEIVPDLGPDVVLTAMGLPGISGVETIRRLGLLGPASRVLVLAEHGLPGAIAGHPGLRLGVNIVAGQVNYRPVAEAVGEPVVDVEEALAGAVAGR